MKKVDTGNKELNYILGGGFPENSLNIIAGLPGTGKTILAESIIFHESNIDHKTLYVSTVAEPLDKIIHYLQDFTFFRPDAIGESIIYHDLSDTLRKESLKGGIDKLKSLVLENQPKFLVIDSFKALHDFSSSVEEFRRFLSEFASLLTALSITTFLVGEYSPEDMAKTPEFAVADGIIELVLKKIAVKDARFVRVVKMRGTSFFGGEHAYKITSDGLDIFPRLTTPVVSPEYDISFDREKTGVEVFDKMISEGFWKGSSTTIFGPPGSGKTLLGMHFIFKGIAMGEKGLIASLQENPIQLARIAKGFGWDLKDEIKKGTLEYIYTSPVDIYIDEFIVKILKIVEEKKVGRILIDSLNDLEAAAPNPERFRDYIYALVQNLAVKNVSVIMTSEIKELFGSSYLSEFGISHISDNVILVHFLREKSEIKRAISVMKTRASDHDQKIRQFTITSDGIKIGEEFSPESIF